MLIFERYFDPVVVGENNGETNKNQNEGHSSKYNVEISRKNQTMLIKPKLFIIKNNDFWESQAGEITKLIFQETRKIFKN